MYVHYSIINILTCKIDQYFMLLLIDKTNNKIILMFPQLYMTWIMYNKV